MCYQNCELKVLPCKIWPGGVHFTFIKDFLINLLMLRQSWRKRHVINLPPPPLKKGLLGGGGVSFLEYFHEFLGLGHKKTFCTNFGAKPMFWNNYRPIPATSGHFVTLGNSKKLGFSVFLGKFGNFFFQNTILDQIGPRTIKNGFSDIL